MAQPSFDAWWSRVNEVAEEESMELPRPDPEQYRAFYNAGHSPLDAVIEANENWPDAAGTMRLTPGESPCS